MTEPKVRLEELETSSDQFGSVRNGSGQFASPVKTPEFEPYAGRLCFICRAEGECAHREPEARLAARQAQLGGPNPLPPPPEFRYWKLNLDRKPMGVARTIEPGRIAPDADSEPERLPWDELPRRLPEREQRGPKAKRKKA
jgi:hypothetical protein